MRLIPFGRTCIDNSGWPISIEQVERYYRRVRRVFAAGPPEGVPWPIPLLKGMAWIGDQQDSVGAGLGGSMEEEDGEEQEQMVDERLEKELPLGEEADVCPAGSLPDNHVCWIL